MVPLLPWARLALPAATALLLLSPERAPAAVLHAVSGDGATPASTLYALDPATGAAREVGPLGHGDDGEGLAFRPGDGLLYHTSGGTDGSEFLEPVNPDDASTGANLAVGASYGPDPAAEIQGLAWYPPLGSFVASDVELGFHHVSPEGQFTRVGDTGVAVRGFAVVDDRLYGVSPYEAQVLELDPATGAVLDVLPLTLGGVPTTGNGLATHPESGVVFALVKDPSDPGGPRLLATLDVASGEATAIGNTGLKLSALAFRTHAPLYAVSGDGASPPSALFTLDLATGAASFEQPLGNGDDGEGLAFRPGSGLLYHSSGTTDGAEFLETIDPATGSVGPNLVSGTYGPAPAQEIGALAWYPPFGALLASDRGFDLFHVTPSGAFTHAGNSGRQLRGFAVVGERVFAVSPYLHELYEIDPDDGVVLSTLPLSVDGVGTTGNALATSPDTGVVFAILKNPLAPSGGRLLATLDVDTGQAVRIGDTGLKLAGLSFGAPQAPEAPILPAPALGPAGGAALAAAALAVALAALRRRAASCASTHSSGDLHRVVTRN